MKIEIIGTVSCKNEAIIELIDDIADKTKTISSDSIVEIIFVEKDEIRKINKTYRKIDKATDVLSFPQISIGKSVPILGSIVICEDIAEEKEETIPELITHGFIHLLGYDHETNQTEWDKMENRINAKI